MIQNYEVIKEEGVTIDSVVFAKGDIMEIDAEVIDIASLLAEGALAIKEEEFPPMTEEDPVNNEAAAE